MNFQSPMGALKNISKIFPGTNWESSLAKEVNNVGNGLLKTIFD